MAEEAVDAVCDTLDIDEECRTHEMPLPGGREHDLTPEAFESVGLDPYAARRILYRHGSRADDIYEMLGRHPEWASFVDPSEPVTEAELRYAIRHELVETLDDCRHRVRLACGMDGGWHAALRAGEIFCDERGLSLSNRVDVALQLQRGRWQNRRAAISGDQLASEELGRHWFFESTGTMGASADHLTDE